MLRGSLSRIPAASPFAVLVAAGATALGLACAGSSDRQTLAALHDGRLGALDWIERRPLAEGGQAFDDLNAGRTPAAKIILTP